MWSLKKLPFKASLNKRIGLMALMVLLANLLLDLGMPPHFPLAGATANPGNAASETLVASSITRAQARSQMANQSLRFEPNVGQQGLDSRVRYFARGSDYTLFLTDEAAVLSFHKPAPTPCGAIPAPKADPANCKDITTAESSPGVALYLKWEGGLSTPKLQATDKLSGVSNYFTGNDPTRWRTNVPGYGRVEYGEIYPGIGLAYYGTGGKPEYDLLVKPGADPSAVHLTYDGADNLRVNTKGELVIGTALGEVVQAPPQLYQNIQGKRVAVQGRYTLSQPEQLLTGQSQRTGDNARALPVIGFAVDGYDHNQTLVIDPLIYSGFLNSDDVDQFDYSLAIAVDGNNSAYIAGYTTNDPFPTTPGAYQTDYKGHQDNFVMKLNPEGNARVYSTYIGGSDGELATGVAVDSSGSAYIVGETASVDYPTTTGAYQTTINNGSYAITFITKLGPEGSTLSYSTLLGGANGGAGFAAAIAVDTGGNVYIFGWGDDPDFPTTPGAYDRVYNGGDAFITKLNPAGTGLVFSTFLGDGFGGPPGYVFHCGIALDAGNNVYVTGTTASPTFPTTPGAFDTTLTTGQKGFVSKLSSDGSGLVYSTFLGGSNDNSLIRIAVDKSGNAYVAGLTDSPDYPTTQNAVQPKFADDISLTSRNGVVTKLNTTGTGLEYSTFLGGPGSTSGGPASNFVFGIAVDNSGDIYLAGTTDSAALPTTPGAFSTSYHGSSDAFVAKINPNVTNPGSSLLYSTYLGGSGVDFGYGIAIDAKGNAYVLGPVGCGFPTTPGALGTCSGGVGQSLLVAKLNFDLNTSWALATNVTTQPGTTQAVFNPIIGTSNTSLWYKIPAGYGSRITLTLSGEASSATPLPADFDLALYRDINLEYEKLKLPVTTTTLPEQSVKAAPYTWMPYTWMPYTWMPYTWMPYTWMPYTWMPYTWMPYTSFGSERQAENTLPYQFRADPTPPPGYQVEAYTGAPEKALLSLSANSGQTLESININTDDYAGDLYIRVTSLSDTGSPLPLRLGINVTAGVCGTITPVSSTLPRAPIPGGNYRTVLLTDTSRLSGTTEEKTALLAKLREFASRSDIQGDVVDLSDSSKYQRVIEANRLADSNLDCPLAKNMVAQEIKQVVEGYRVNSSNLQYVVLAGPDHTIPFFRYLDRAAIANEKEYTPVLNPDGAAARALKGNLMLSQDAYGSQQEMYFQNQSIPIPQLAVGRLVTTPAQITGMLDAYNATNGQISPQTALATGYDFVTDTARAVRDELQDATGQTADILIDPSNWNASQLRQALLNNGRHDIIFLAGHFSAGHAEAADATTSLGAYELASSDVDFTNTLIYSVGCHSGYNISPEDALVDLTENPDWAQAFATKGMTAVLGTGYQYGDTDLIEYSEKLYLEFTRQLHTGVVSGNGKSIVPVGHALVKAKQDYLDTSLPFSGLHEKVVAEATLYGLPMLKVQLNGHAPATDNPVVGSPSPVTQEPGYTLGLRTADYTLTPSLSTHKVPLTNTENGSTLEATYLTGSAGQTAVNGLDPILPLELRNATVSGQVLRGVGFLRGSFTDTEGLFPLTPGTATEFGPTRIGFNSPNFYPTQLWTPQYGSGVADGTAHLAVIPAQFRSSTTNQFLGTLRQYKNLELRLYYSNNTSDAAKAMAPGISEVTAKPAGNTIVFSAKVEGVTSAGVQSVWVTYYFEGGTSWESVDLTADTTTSGLWNGTLTLPAGQDYSKLRFMVQAVNGVGVVGLSTNGGAYYSPVTEVVTPPVPATASVLTVSGLVASYAYQDRPALTFSLNTAAGNPVTGAALRVGLAGQYFNLTTDSNGQTGLNIGGSSPVVNLRQLPGTYQVTAAFEGDSANLPVSFSKDLTVTKRATSLAFTVSPALSSYQFGQDTGVAVTLTDNTGNRLANKTVVLVATAIPGGQTCQTSVSTDNLGIARLGAPVWEAGTYRLAAYFAGNIPGMNVVSDDLYLPSSATASSNLTLTSRAATLGYSATDLETTKPTLKAQVTPTLLTPPVNLSLAEVSFVLVQNGTTVLNKPVQTDVNGVAQVSLEGLAAGSYTLQLTLTDGYFSAPPVQAEIKLGSNLLATTTILTAVPNPSISGQEVQLTASVTSTSGGGTPTGLVEFRDGPNILGSASLSAGSVVLKVTTLAKGSHILTAHYNGDNSFEASDSNSVVQTVNQAVSNSLVFVTQPGGAVAGKPFAKQPVLKVIDSRGKLLTNVEGQVTLTIKDGSGAAEAKLSGKTTVKITKGLASFTDLSIDLAARDYVLVATAPNLTRAESLPFTVVATDGCPGVPLGRFCAQYYNNRDLQDNPALERFENRVSYDWGNGSPDPKVNRDNFSARWQGKFNFEAGTYTFHISTDDGMRLFVDGNLLINGWRDQAQTAYQADLQFKSAGVHEIKVEYYEHLGKAVAKVNWFRNISACSQVSAGQFCASYFNNRDLSGAPVLMRAESDIDFDWGWDSPRTGVVRSDNFSVRWVGQFQFATGTYIFKATTDDGMKVYVDGKLLINQWKDQPSTDFTTRIDLAEGVHEVKVEYYEHFGEAVAIVNWNKK
jgi:RNase P/RNase MRP subunit p29